MSYYWQVIAPNTHCSLFPIHHFCVLTYIPYFLYYTLVSNKLRSIINASCKPTVYKINAGSLINAGGVTQSHVAIIAHAMATKRKAYAVTTKLQAVKVAEKTSKKAVAMWAENSQLTVSTAMNTTNTP